MRVVIFVMVCFIDLVFFVVSMDRLFIVIVMVCVVELCFLLG